MILNELNPFKKSNQGTYEIINYIWKNTVRLNTPKNPKKHLSAAIEISKIKDKFKFNSNDELLSFLKNEISAGYIMVYNSKLLPAISLCDNYLRSERIKKINLLLKSAYLPLLISVLANGISVALQWLLLY